MFNKMVQILLMVFVLALLFILPSSLPASNPEGTVLVIRDGKLERLEKNNWKALTMKSPVRLGDHLRTDAKSVAVIQLPELGKIVIGSSSEVVLGQNPRVFDSQLKRGAIWMHATLPAGTRASVSTDLATAGVRSTRFAVMDNGKVFDVCTCEGEVEVSLKDGSKETAKRGDQVVVDSSSPNRFHKKSGKQYMVDKKNEPTFCYLCHDPDTGKGLQNSILK